MTQEQCFTGTGFEKEIVPIPVVVRAAGIVLALNILIAIWFYFSPNLSTGTAPKLEQQTYSVAAGKMSPFTPVAVQKTRKGVKLPPKAEPYFAEVVPPSGSLN
jgi:hypothetical protein